MSFFIRGLLAETSVLLARWYLAHILVLIDFSSDTVGTEYIALIHVFVLIYVFLD